MPSQNPFEHDPASEANYIDTAEAFRPEDWLGPKTERAIIHLERKVLLEQVRTHLERIAPLLHANDGFCFFKTWINEGEQLTVLIADNERLAVPGTVAVSSNTLRPANTDEPHFPNGQSLIMADLAVPKRSRWLSYAWETFERGQHVHKWDKPEFATIHEPHDRYIRLVGNLATSPMTPCPADNLEGVIEHSWRYSAAIDSLAHCTEVTFEESIRDFST